MNEKPPAPIRAAIYARFSSHLQDPRSIEDQVRLCREKLSEIGVDSVRVHADAQVTGTITQSRPALARLLQDAKYGLIDLVCAEALDRISRDQEDLAGIYKRLRFWNVRLITLDQGEIGPIHIGIGGLMNQAFIENLAFKTRRGQIGAVHAKRIPGGLCYGYRNANRIDEQGKALRGLREVHPEQAETVRRIYRLYSDGMSPRKIAATLNEEGIPAPRGGTWGSTTINGHRGRRNGILNNELYRGRLVYGRQKFIRDPDTGKRQARPVPPSDWVVQDVPELRIVDDALWERVQTRRQAGHDRRRNPGSGTPLPLTGLVRCGVCGGAMTIVKPRRYGCHTHTDKGTCDNPRGIDPTVLENQVIPLLSRRVAEEFSLPDLVRRAGEESALRRERLAAAVAEGEERISRLLDAIEQGAQSHAAHRRILDIEHETAAIQLELDSLPTVPTDAPEGLATRLQDRLAALHRAVTLAGPDAPQRKRALLFARSLIERIHIAPLPGRGQVEISVRPRADALVAFALDDEWAFVPDTPPDTNQPGSDDSSDAGQAARR